MSSRSRAAAAPSKSCGSMHGPGHQSRGLYVQPPEPQSSKRCGVEAGACRACTGAGRGRSDAEVAAVLSPGGRAGCALGRCTPCMRELWGRVLRPRCSRNQCGRAVRWAPPGHACSNAALVRSLGRIADCVAVRGKACAWGQKACLERARSQHRDLPAAAQPDGQAAHACTSAPPPRLQITNSGSSASWDGHLRSAVSSSIVAATSPCAQRVMTAKGR